MAKKIIITFNNPSDEADVDHMELWWKLGSGGTYAKLGNDITFVAGVADYVVEDTSGNVTDGASLYYEARAYGVGGGFAGTEQFVVVSTDVVEFYGYTEVDVTSITIPSIESPEGLKTGTAPFAFCASAQNVTCAGSRNLSAKAVNPYEHLEHRWNITKTDGSPVLYHEGEIKNAETGVAVNPYTDTISPEGTFLLREVGTYAITLTSRGKTATGYITQVFSETVTVTKPNVSHKWYDGANGNDTNDGLDAHGFGLASAVYTESTGELTQAGAFAGYNHVTATASYPENNSNFIYITKAGVTGLYEIASKTDSNTIVLKDKLGSNQTAITSSDGAKATFNGVAVVNEFTHLAGGQTYNTTNEYAFNGTQADELGIFGYGGIALITSSANRITQQQINSSSVACRKLMLMDVSPVCTTSNVSGFGGVLSTNVDSAMSYIILGRGVINKGNSNTAMSIQSTAGKPLVTFNWGNTCEGRATQQSAYTLAAGNNIGNTTIVVNETINPADLADGAVTIAGDYYVVTGFTGSTFLLKITGYAPVALLQSYSAGVAAVHTEHTSGARYTKLAIGSWERSVGETVKSDCRDALREHYLYPSSYGHNNFHAGWMRAVDGNGRNNYIFNLDNRGVTRLYTSLHDCYCTGANWFTDMSNADNYPDDGFFEHFVISRNKAKNLNNGFVWMFTAKSFFARDNEVFSDDTATFRWQAFLQAQEGSPAPAYVQADHEFVLEGNRLYGYRLMGEANNSNREAVNNTVWSTQTDQLTIDAGSAQSVKGNIFYAPLDADGVHLGFNNSAQAIGTFNTLVGNDNSEAKPNWTDPANGDFTPDESAPTASGTYAPPAATIGVAYSYNTAPLFTGVSATSYVFNGTLPAGLSFSTASGIISGMPTTAQTMSNTSVTGTNAYGSSTTNTGDIVVAGFTAQTFTFAGGQTLDITSVTLQSGDTVTFTFNASTLGAYRHLLSGGTDDCELRIRSTEAIQFSKGSVTVDGTSKGNYSSLSAYLDDADHVLVFTASQQVTIDLVGANRFGNDKLNNCAIVDLAFVIAAGPDTTYAIDSGSTTTEDASVGTGTMTLNGVTAANWS